MACSFFLTKLSCSRFQFFYSFVRCCFSIPVKRNCMFGSSNSTPSNTPILSGLQPDYAQPLQQKRYPQVLRKMPTRMLVLLSKKAEVFRRPFRPLPAFVRGFKQDVIPSSFVCFNQIPFLTTPYNSIVKKYIPFFIYSDYVSSNFEYTQIFL